MKGPTGRKLPDKLKTFKEFGFSFEYPAGMKLARRTGPGLKGKPSNQEGLLEIGQEEQGQLLTILWGQHESENKNTEEIRLGVRAFLSAFLLPVLSKHSKDREFYLETVPYRAGRFGHPIQWDRYLFRMEDHYVLATIGGWACSDSARMFLVCAEALYSGPSFLSELVKYNGGTKNWLPIEKDPSYKIFDTVMRSFACCESTATAGFAGPVKHYTNKEHAFSFDYPKDWELFHGEDLNDVSEMLPSFARRDLRYIVVFTGNKATNYSENLSVSVLPLTVLIMNENDWKQVADQMDATYPHRVSKFNKISDRIVSIDGLKGLEYVFRRSSFGRDSQQKFVKIAKKGKGYAIVCTADKDDFQNFDNNYFRPIINSFRVSSSEKSTSVLGAVRGRLIGRDTHQPLAAAVVVLCKILDKLKCNVQANLTAITDAKGRFTITDVTPGCYTIAYAPAEEKAAVSLKDGYVADFTSGSSLSGLTLVEGGLKDVQLGLNFEIRQGHFISFEVSQGKGTKVEVTAWNL